MSRVVVVGAGVIGLWCALELRNRGADVTVLDKEWPGAGCSSGNAGWIAPSLSGPLPGPGLRSRALRWALLPTSPLHISLRADGALLRWLWQFWRRCNERDYARGLDAIARLHADSQSLYAAAHEEGLQFELHRAGLLLLFLSRSAYRHARDDLARLTAYGYEHPRELDRRAVREVEPAAGPEVTGGILAKTDWHVRPESLVSALVDRLTAHGVAVRSGAEVRAFEAAGARAIACRTSVGRVPFDHCVIAAGVWSAPLLRQVGYELPLEAGKGYSITLSPAPFRVARPLYLAEAKVACTPFRGALRAAGTMELSGFNTRLDRRRVRAMDRAIARFLPAWRPHPGRHEWAGMRPVTPDGLPAIGRVPGFDNLFVATGHAMLGVSLAPATARGVSRLLAGEQAQAPGLAAFDPARFCRGARRGRSHGADLARTHPAAPRSGDGTGGYG